MQGGRAVSQAITDGLTMYALGFRTHHENMHHENTMSLSRRNPEGTAFYGEAKGILIARQLMPHCINERNTHAMYLGSVHCQ